MGIKLLVICFAIAGTNKHDVFFTRPDMPAKAKQEFRTSQFQRPGKYEN
jgi:hypothetical protein